MDGYSVMHHCTIEEKLDGSQPALQPVSRSPLQSVNRQPLQPVNRQPLQQASLNFSEVEQFHQPVNQRQLVATHPVGPRKPIICSVGHRNLLSIQQAPDSSSNPSRPQIPPATSSGPRRPTTCSGGLSLVQEAASHSVGLPVIH